MDNNQKLKLEVMEHYARNGVVSCVACGYSDIRAIELDHILDNGKEHRIKVNKWGQNFYHYLKKSQYIDDKEYPIQLLCSNCNSIKEYNRRSEEKK